jgi:hypothetical protein
LDFSRVPFPAAMMAMAIGRSELRSGAEVDGLGIGFNITWTGVERGPGPRLGGKIHRLSSV